MYCRLSLSLLSTWKQSCESISFNKQVKKCYLRLMNKIVVITRHSHSNTSNSGHLTMQTSIQNLKGKVLEKPEKQLWRVNRQARQGRAGISSRPEIWSDHYLTDWLCRPTRTTNTQWTMRNQTGPPSTATFRCRESRWEFIQGCRYSQGKRRKPYIVLDQ